MVKVTRINLCLFIFLTTIVQNSVAPLPGAKTVGRLLSRGKSSKQREPVDIPAPSKPAAGANASQIPERSSPEVEYDDRPVDEFEYFNRPREISEAEQAQLLSQQLPAAGPYDPTPTYGGGYSSDYSIGTGWNDLSTSYAAHNTQDDDEARQVAANNKAWEDYRAQNTPPVIPTNGYNEGHLQQYTNHFYSNPGGY